MTDKRLRVFAAAGYLAIVAMGISGILLRGRVVADDLFGVPFFAFSTVGLVVVLKIPRNPVGWVFMFVGATPTTGFFTSSYAAHSLAGADLPAALIFEWVSSWAWFPGIGTLITFGLLLFPEGRLPSRGWRPVGAVALLLLITATLAMAFKPGPMEPFEPTLPSSPNPMGIDAFGGILATIESIAFSLVPIVGLLCAASLIFRFRRASSLARQQLKWFGYSTAMLIAIMVSENILDNYLGAAAEYLFFVGMIFPSVAAGIAILRYRLYDIDLVINRTLVYGLLTAALLASYLIIVVMLSRVLDPVTRDSDIAVAASTLAVAALFRPLRTRFQGFIDRRFYRSKYDAARALKGFGARLRDEIEVDVVRDDVLGLVRDTLQPSHASVWMKPGEAT